MLFGLNIATRDITAIAIAISFNIMLSILPPPIRAIVLFIMPFFMFVFIEAVAAHKWTSVLLITGFHTLFFYLWAIPRFELLNSFAEEMVRDVNSIIASYDPTIKLPNATALTLFALILEPLDYLASYFCAKETVEGLKLKKRVGGIR